MSKDFDEFYKMIKPKLNDIQEYAAEAGYIEPERQAVMVSLSILRSYHEWIRED